MPPSDLTELISGDPAAWDAFVRSHTGLAQSAIRRILRQYAGTSNESDVQEISQDFFLRLVSDDFRLLRSYDSSRASLATWLVVLVRNRTVDHLRARRSTAPLDEAGDIAGKPSVSTA